MYIAGSLQRTRPYGRRPDPPGGPAKLLASKHLSASVTSACHTLQCWPTGQWVAEHQHNAKAHSGKRDIHTGNCQLPKDLQAMNSPTHVVVFITRSKVGTFNQCSTRCAASPPTNRNCPHISAGYTQIGNHNATTTHAPALEDMCTCTMLNSVS